MLANNRLLRYLQIDFIAANLKEWAASDTDEWMECDTLDDNYREHHYADLAGGHLGQYIAGYVCHCFDLWDLLPEGSFKKGASSDYPLVDCDAWNDMDMQLSIWMDEINTYILHEDSGYFDVPENVTLNIGYWEPDSSYVLYFRETTY